MRVFISRIPNLFVWTKIYGIVLLSFDSCEKHISAAVPRLIVPIFIKKVNSARVLFAQLRSSGLEIRKKGSWLNEWLMLKLL